MSLRSWLQNGCLVEHITSPEEIGNLLAIADRDLAASPAPKLPSDWRLAIAYNAALRQMLLWLQRVIGPHETATTTA